MSDTDQEMVDCSQEAARGSGGAQGGGGGREERGGKSQQKKQRRGFCGAVKSVAQPKASARNSSRNTARGSAGARGGGRGREERIDVQYAKLDSKITRLEEARCYVKRDALDNNIVDVVDENPAAVLRELYSDSIQLDLRNQLGEKRMKEMYPRRAARSKPTGATGARASPDQAYADQLNGIEQTWNRHNAACDQPPVIILDWTGLPPAGDELAALQYTQHSTVEAAVAEFINRRQELHTNLNCKDGCTACYSDGGTAGHCCRTSFVEISGGVRFVEAGKQPIEELPATLECTDECGCSPVLCKHREVQKGRQFPVAIFRDVIFGWSLRALTEIQEQEFIVEYVGEVSMEPTRGRGRIYDFQQSVKVPRPLGPRRPLIIAASKLGNESRFAPHSCSPNAAPYNFVTSRHALYNHKVAFRAIKKIRRGQNITFDYFPGRGPADVNTSSFFEECGCGTVECRFTKAAILAVKDVIVID